MTFHEIYQANLNKPFMTPMKDQVLPSVKKTWKRRAKRNNGSGAVTPAPDKKEEDSIHERTPSPA
jgi:hypothetical protein